MRSARLGRLCAAPLLLTAVSLCGPARAAAPSFSCDKATAPVDRAICGDAGLSVLDLALERAFRVALAGDPAGRDAMLKAQRAWAKGRTEACHLAGSGPATQEQISCLAELTRKRIAALRPRDPRDAKLAAAIADEIRRKDGYIGRGESLIEALGEDPDSPIRFGAAGELTDALAAKLPAASDDLKREGKIYRMGDHPPTLALAAVEGSAHCWSYSVFRETEAKYEAVADPRPEEAEGMNCGEDIGFGHAVEDGHDPETPLFAEATYDLAGPTLLLLALRGSEWHRIGTFALDYETSLAVSARSCAAQAACADLAGDALALARARDAAGDAAGQAAPERLGAAVRIRTLQQDTPAALPVFGKDSFDAWSDFEADAPVYELGTTAGPVAMRVSHGTIGWRTNEDYDVAAYRKEKDEWQPVAGFQIAKTRVKLRSVTVE